MTSVLAGSGFSCNFRAPRVHVDDSVLQLCCRLWSWNVDVCLGVVGKTMMVQLILIKHFVQLRGVQAIKFKFGHSDYFYRFYVLGRQFVCVAHPAAALTTDLICPVDRFEFCTVVRFCHASTQHVAATCDAQALLKARLQRRNSTRINSTSSRVELCRYKRPFKLVTHGLSITAVKKATARDVVYYAFNKISM